MSWKTISRLYKVHLEKSRRIKNKFYLHLELFDLIFMETNYFQLGNSDKNRFVNVLKIIFGVVCIAVGVYWIIYKIDVPEKTGSAWVTILFMLGFGAYEIFSGLGKAERFIEIGKATIRLKKSIFLPAKNIETSEIDRIEIFPLKIIFYLKREDRLTLRFGTTYYETNEKIIDSLVKLAKQNQIDMELIKEEI